MVANHEYVFGRPKLDEIEVRFMLDIDTMVSNLLAGTVDLSLGRGFSVEQALDVKHFVGSNFARYRNPELDSLIERFLTAVPRPERLDLLRQVVYHISDQLNKWGCSTTRKSRWSAPGWTTSPLLRSGCGPSTDGTSARLAAESARLPSASGRGAFTVVD